MKSLARKTPFQFEQRKLAADLSASCLNDRRQGHLTGYLVGLFQALFSTIAATRMRFAHIHFTLVFNANSSGTGL